jgi:hypothetical protein
MDADLKACTILERLTDQLHDATVEYQCVAGVHEFFVRCAGSRYSIRLPELSLLRRSVQDLEQLVGQVVERIRIDSPLRPAPQ